MGIAWSLLLSQGTNGCSLCWCAWADPDSSSEPPQEPFKPLQCSSGWPSGDFSECLSQVGLGTAVSLLLLFSLSVGPKLHVVIYMKPYQNTEWDWYLLVLWAVPWHHSELFLFGFFFSSQHHNTEGHFVVCFNLYIPLPKPHLDHPLYVQSGVLA